MRRSDLGEFEEVVLLAVAALHPEAYSVAIAEALESELGRSITTGAVHAALQRMEKKGYLDSSMGEATASRGGRRKRFAYSIDLTIWLVLGGGSITLLIALITSIGSTLKISLSNPVDSLRDE